MIKKAILIIALCAYGLSLSAQGSGTERLRAMYTAELGVREATGRNDGSRVEQYLAYVHLKKGQPWCASFVCFCLGEAGLPNPRSGWSPNLFPNSRLIWQRGKGVLANRVSGKKEPPGAGDVFGIFFAEQGRIAHAGFVDEWGEKYFITVEGNTNEGGGREGEGVYRKRRLISSIYKVSRWK